MTPLIEICCGNILKRCLNYSYSPYRRHCFSYRVIPDELGVHMGKEQMIIMVLSKRPILCAGFQYIEEKLFHLDESQRGEQLFEIIYAKGLFLDEYRIIEHTYEDLIFMGYVMFAYLL